MNIKDRMEYRIGYFINGFHISYSQHSFNTKKEAREHARKMGVKFFIERQPCRK